MACQGHAVEPYTRYVADGTKQLIQAGEDRFWAGVADAGKFFIGDADVQRALTKLARLLDDARIPYAVLGAMALNEYGYRRVTIDPSVRPKYRELWKAAQAADIQ